MTHPPNSLTAIESERACSDLADGLEALCDLTAGLGEIDSVRREALHGLFRCLHGAARAAQRVYE